MTASNEGVVAWQMRSIRLAPDGSNFNWLDCSKESHDSINDDRYSPYEARALVPDTALTALQAELDAANAKCAALIKENAAAEAIIWRKVDEAEAKHAALVAGVEGLADSWEKIFSLNGFAVSDELRALLAGGE
jgi:hypothetical protein